MEHSVELNTFLENHKFAQINVQELSNSLLADMELGLRENNKSQQLMAVMPFQVNTKRPENRIIVIDAGGTNFRSCLVEFSEEGNIKISEEHKSSMIALDREYSKEDFFYALEDKINYLKDKADEIHFCFSYAMKNLPDGDAQVITFSKQVKAKAVAGSLIGKELMEVLKEKGWTSVKKIKVVNDTLACLLSGMSLGSQNYDAYIGFILGTGINNAYIEKGKIEKIKDDLKEHIVVCECGMFNEVPLSDFDKSLDMNSTNPGNSLLEKLCSGVYIGKIAKLAIETACAEGLFSQDFGKRFENISDFSAYEISLFLQGSKEKDNILEGLCSDSKDDDRLILTELLKTIVDRSAKVTAAVISATSLKTKANNVCVTCNGSTFWKTSGLKEKVEKLLQIELKEKHNINFEIVKVENDITAGTALA